MPVQTRSQTKLIEKLIGHPNANVTIRQKHTQNKKQKLLDDDDDEEWGPPISIDNDTLQDLNKLHSFLKKTNHIELKIEEITNPFDENHP
jgi:hypothetical protein